MNRRNVVFGGSGAIAVAAASISGRTIPLARLALVSRTLPQVVRFGPYAGRVIAARIPVSAAVVAGLVVPGTFLVAPSSARAEPFSIMFGICIGIILNAIGNRNGQRDHQLADASSWDQARSRTGSLHDRTGALQVLRTDARFQAEGGRGVVADASDGKFRMISPTTARDPRLEKDLNGLETVALADSGFVFPRTPRIEPTGDARKKLEEAYAVMGGKLGTSDGAYVRFFSNAAGDQTVGVSNGTRAGQDVLMVSPQRAFR